MKKFICVLLALFLVPAGIAVNAESSIGVSAKAAVLMDAETGQIIYEKNANEKMSMASTTKVMTALLAQDYIDAMGDSLVKITDEMVRVEGSSMGLKAGDKLHISDLIAGMLLPSGNDAANAAALFMCKSLDDFAVQMNKKAAKIGMDNSSFVTPSGLDHENHYSTAFDMALLTAEAIKNEDFLSVFSKKTDKINYNGGKSTLWLKNHNKLLSLYKDCIGGKTGFTKKSGRCLVTAAKRGDSTLIAVTLNAPDDWNDHINMYNYGFEMMKTAVFEAEEFIVPKAEGGAVKIRVLPCEKTYITGEAPRRVISLPRFIYSSQLVSGMRLGTVTYYSKDKKIQEYKITVK